MSGVARFVVAKRIIRVKYTDKSGAKANLFVFAEREYIVFIQIY